MPQAVATEIGEQQGIALTAINHLLVAAKNDTAQRFVQCSKVLWLTKTIDEDEISIPCQCNGGGGCVSSNTLRKVGAESACLVLFCTTTMEY